MNVTLSIDADTVARARSLAESQGTSLNQVIRDYLAHYAATGPARTVGSRLTELLDAGAVGHSGGGRFAREELYADRLDRYGKP